MSGETCISWISVSWFWSVWNTPPSSNTLTMWEWLENYSMPINSVLRETIMPPEQVLQKRLETCSWEPFCKTEYKIGTKSRRDVLVGISSRKIVDSPDQTVGSHVFWKKFPNCLLNFPWAACRLCHRIR